MRLETFAAPNTAQRISPLTAVTFALQIADVRRVHTVAMLVLMALRMSGWTIVRSKE